MRLSIVATLLVSLVAAAGFAGFARTAAASSLYVVAGNSVQIPAGGTGYLQVRGISMQPGSQSPAGSLALAAQQLQAGDKARTAIYYGIDWGYSDSAPDQVALALWWTQDGNWQAQDHAIAQRIGEAAVNAQGIPSWNPQGRNLLTSISQGQASVSALTLSPEQQVPWVGDGNLAIQNTSNSDLVLYLPYGTLFSSASGSVIVWATGAGSAPGAVTPTAQAALSPTPEATEPAQATNTPEATATGAVPTDTPTPRDRKVPPGQQPTDTPVPPPLTPKAPPATSVPPSDTPAPPMPTDTPQPTNTPQPTSTTPPPPPPSNTPTAVQPQGSKGKQTGQPLPPAQPAQQGGSGQVAGNQASGGQQSRPPASVPLAPASAPLPPTPGPTQSATPAVPAPAATGASAAAPLPVGTSDAPPPVDTAPAQATVPFPVLTVYPTAVPSTPLATKPLPPTAEPTFPQPSPTPQSAVEVPTLPSAASSQKPTPAPTAAPPPAATDSGGTVKPTEPPVIVVGPATKATPSGGQNGGGSASGGSQGTPPKVNPVTGAGPSDMPLWLSAAALIMLLGGWMLRRVGRAPAVLAPHDKQYRPSSKKTRKGVAVSDPFSCLLLW